MKHAANTSAWALGRPGHGGFLVRRVVWGYALAVEECRPDEQIRAAKIMVEDRYNRRRLPKGKEKLFDPE
jgi:hypothetical protein